MKVRSASSHVVRQPCQAAPTPPSIPPPGAAHSCSQLGCTRARNLPVLRGCWAQKGPGPWLLCPLQSVLLGPGGRADRIPPCVHSCLSDSLSGPDHLLLVTPDSLLLLELRRVR